MNTKFIPNMPRQNGGKFKGIIHSMTPLLVLFAMLLVFTGCVHSEPKIGKAIKITPDEFVDRNLVLDSNMQVERYHFFKDGTVSTTIGEKRNTFHWEIVTGRTLVMTGSMEKNFSVTITLQFQSLTHTSAITTSGKRYRLE